VRRLRVTEENEIIVLRINCTKLVTTQKTQTNEATLGLSLLTSLGHDRSCIILQRLIARPHEVSLGWKEMCRMWTCIEWTAEQTTQLCISIRLSRFT